MSTYKQTDLLQQLDRAAPFFDAEYRDEKADLLLYINLAKQIPGPVLEVGCGTGRVLAALIGADKPCDGLELSPAMLALAQRRCEGMLGKVPWGLVQGDMTAFELVRRDYGLAILASNTLMHSSCSIEQENTLKCLYQHLRPGGVLALDLFNPPVSDLVLQSGVTQAVDFWSGPKAGSTVTKWVRREVNWVEQLQETFITYETLFADDRLEKVEVHFTLRFLWRHEVQLMLEKIGFKVQTMWGSYTREPIDDNSEVMVFIGRK